VAKRAVERYIREKEQPSLRRRSPSSPSSRAAAQPRSTFNHLHCCQEHAELRQRIALAEQRVEKGTKELDRVKRCHNWEVDQLISYVAYLKAQVARQESGHCSATTASLLRRRKALIQQIAETKDATEAALRQAESAERAAAVQQARLEEFRAAHERTVADLHSQLPQPYKELCADDRELLARCAELEGPASRTLQRFGRVLPEAPSFTSAGDPKAAEAWLQAVTAALEGVAGEVEEACARTAPSEHMAAAG